MKEILALDAWQRSGPAAAAAILAEPENFEISALVRYGVDADRVRFLAWAKRRVALHMSILLDGESSGKNVERAYQALIGVKGRFLVSQREVTRDLERGWYNPHIDAPRKMALLNQLGQIRRYHSHLVMPAILGTGSIDQTEIAGVERTEAAILAALSTESQPGDSGIPALPALEPDASLIDFVEWQRTDRRTQALMPAEYGAFVTTGQAPVRFVRLGPVSEIDPDILLLSKKGQGSSAIKQALRRLYGKLIAPLDPWLPHAHLRGVPRIFVVPDGRLTLAPVAALIGPDDQYFLTGHRVSYLVDSQALYSVWMGPAWAVSRPVVLGNPDFTMALDPAYSSPPWPKPFKPLGSEKDFESEAADVAKALGLPHDHLVVGKMAREELLRGLLGPKLLHLATHSKGNIDWNETAARWELFEYPPLLSSQNPFLRSYIALAGANLEQPGPEDGLLTALEVQSLHLEGTQLVVLSSCEAGEGAAVDGLGLTGLRGAFWRAGAKGLVTDLWREYGEAGHNLMKSFYQHLGDAGGPAEALRQAQLEMIKSPLYSDPFYWAGFSYSGLSEPVQLSLPGGETPWKDSESLAEPSCIEVSAHSSDGHWSMRDRLRIRIGPLVRLQKKSPGAAVYELFAPGSDVEYSTSTTIDNSMPVVDPDGRVASQLEDQILLTVRRTKSESSVIIQTRSTKVAKGTPIYTVRLKGGPDLFPSFGIPQAFPPLSAYREATVEGFTNKTLKIDSVQYSGSDLPTQ